MRADAERNRRVLLDVAARVFREIGVDAPLEVIARRAGVGIATLYRHFPQRASLVTAVATDVMARTLTEACAAAAEEPDGLSALRRFMHRALDIGAPAIMPLVDPEVRTGADVKPLLDATAAAQTELIARATEEGSLRPGVQFSDVGLALARFSRLLGHGFDPALEAEIAHRHLDIFVDGLRHHSGPPLAGTDLPLRRLRRMGRPTGPSE